MDCHTVWNPGGGDSSPSSAGDIECACGPKSIIVGGQATAYSHPSQLDIRLSRAATGGDPFFGEETIGAKAGDEAAVVEPEGRCRGGIGAPTPGFTVE